MYFFDEKSALSSSFLPQLRSPYLSLRIQNNKGDNKRVQGNSPGASSTADVSLEPLQAKPCGWLKDIVHTQIVTESCSPLRSKETAGHHSPLLCVPGKYKYVVNVGESMTTGP